MTYNLTISENQRIALIAALRAAAETDDEFGSSLALPGHHAAR